MSRVTSSYFAKHFYDIYSEYITPCTVIIYATSDALCVTRSRLHTLHLGAAVWSDWVDNIMYGSQREIGKPFYFILFEAMNKFSCLMWPIVHAHNAGISWLRSYARLRSYAWLWSYAWLRSEDTTPVLYPDTGHSSRFWSMSRLRSYPLTLIMHHGSGRWSCRMSYHLRCERLCMAGLDDYNILQPRHLVRSRVGGTYDSFSVQNLSISRLQMFKS
jgi:hypothetical protein